MREGWINTEDIRIMKIDIMLQNDELLFRFESDFIPRKGETITDPKTREDFKVMEVNHLLRIDHESNRKLSLVTLEVNKVSRSM